MELARYDAHELVDELVEVAEGKVGFVELAFGIDALHDGLDMGADTGGRGIDQRTGGGLHGVRQHDDGGFLALRARAGIGIILQAGVLAQLQGLVVEEHGPARTVVLLDDVGYLAAEAVFLSGLHALLHMGEKNEGAHGRGELVVRVRAAELVLNEVLGAGYLADIVVQGRHLAEQAVRPDGRRTGFHKVGDHEGVVVRARQVHHEFLKQRMLKVHELHHAEARGIAHHHLDDGAEGEEQEQREHGVHEKRHHKQGKLGQLDVHAQSRACAGDEHPQEKRYTAPHHVLPVLGAEHQPRIGHGGHEVEEEQGKVAAEDERGKEGEQKAHGAVAPRREDERGKAGPARHGEGEGEKMRRRHRRHGRKHPHQPPCGRAEGHEQERDEVLVLGAEHRPLRAAGRDEKAQQKERAEQDAAAEHIQVDEVGGGAEQGLQFKLLFMRHHIAGAHQHLAYLHLVEHRLHRGSISALR